ncbi:MAG: tripartite tricarboxylate transporter TctB family protein [Xanthobacteraceae bacterium]
MPGDSEPAERIARWAMGEILIAIGVLVLAAILFWQTILIPVSPIYAQVGPKAVPYLTAFGVACLGALLLVEALRGGWQSAGERSSIIDVAALLWIGAGLVLNVLFIGPLGFTLASIVLFVCVARGFGSRALVRDASVAAAFALLAYFGFAKTLGINIGAGVLENAIEGLLANVGLGEGA